MSTGLLSGLGEDDDIATGCGSVGEATALVSGDDATVRLPAACWGGGGGLQEEVDCPCC